MSSEPMRVSDAIATGGTRRLGEQPVFQEHEPVQMLSATAERRALLTRIIQAYPSRIVRAYCKIRFLIIRQGFLDEIGQYLPAAGTVLDVGCGFGLFSLYFAGSGRERHLTGFDLNASRIDTARRAANYLGLSNVKFACADARTYMPEQTFDAIYALDLLHHLPQAMVPEFIERLHQRLRPSGVLVLKDVNSRPAYKRWFTLALDRLMVGFREPIRYWPTEEMVCLLRRTGFQVYTHTIRDILPYPHQMYICRKA